MHGALTALTLNNERPAGQSTGWTLGLMVTPAVSAETRQVSLSLETECPGRFEPPRAVADHETVYSLALAMAADALSPGPGWDRQKGNATVLR